MKQKTKKNRKYLINKKFQLGYALEITAIQIPCILATGISLSWFYLIFMDRQMQASCNLQIFIQMFLLVLIFSCVVMFFAVRLTHSIAGPVQKTGAALRQIAKGDLPGKKVVFRKKDAFQNLSDDLNQMIETLKKDRQNCEMVRQQLASLRDDIAANTNQSRCMAKIEEMLNIMNRKRS
ncbi:MAG: methyl-accepting chemotaxis protein [Desulfobacter sp.]|nr:methyl-accepting chemotaxis protein [Desulfobacter sp.]